MKFQLKNLILNQASLIKHIERRMFLTYVNNYSLKADDLSVINFAFVADGWPVRLFSSIHLRKNVSLLSFYRARDVWTNFVREKNCILVGHSIDELYEIKRWADRSPDVNFTEYINGYDSLEVLEQKVRSISIDDVDIIFFALGQPKQEQLMNKLFDLEGKVSIVACGAHWLQEAGLTQAPSNFISNIGLFGVMRFWRNPKKLWNRTFGALPYLFRNLKE